MAFVLPLCDLIPEVNIKPSWSPLFFLFSLQAEKEVQTLKCRPVKQYQLYKTSTCSQTLPLPHQSENHTSSVTSYIIHQHTCWWFDDPKEDKIILQTRSLDERKGGGSIRSSDKGARKSESWHQGRKAETCTEPGERSQHQQHQGQVSGQVSRPTKAGAPHPVWGQFTRWDSYILCSLWSPQHTQL